MSPLLVLICMLGRAVASRPFLDAPDTGIEKGLQIPSNGSLPSLDRLFGMNDFNYVAEKLMNPMIYASIRAGAASEWSYRNNLESFEKLRFRPRVMVNATKIDASMKTSILGDQFDAPFFISPFANAGFANEEAEAALVRGAGDHGILYIASQASTLSMESIVASKQEPKQVLWQQILLDSDTDVLPVDLFKQIENNNMTAIVLTVDSTADRTTYRSRRSIPDPTLERDPRYIFLSWEFYNQLQALTSLPIIPKGIQTVEDARKAIEYGAPAIFISNHGGRSLDGAPSALEVAWEIYKKDPNIFNEIEVYADGGIRYGSDVLKLLALGVRAVGMGRPFMYANFYGHKGISRAISLMKKEITAAGANLGLQDLKDIDATYVS
ncbi:uncharacterized protein BDZ83DRAFT_741425 [Colletotrichum acutatum]|uniref:FMN hydroxy acid dehydrogenase domain-containing protein n=1 Tax=Glomerella acutata TaxID=27357 RepID=A0AAD8ULY3_GLOAC|nr:uncharacterized protein BDZ83DRAFT_741425 [Colletotrichum acutatum]KAK1724385.1 hypothetical protein BDZ83DRAFT_741425 [Colletotrichum acutatum]